MTVIRIFKPSFPFLKSNSVKKREFTAEDHFIANFSYKLILIRAINRHYQYSLAHTLAAPPPSKARCWHSALAGGYAEGTRGSSPPHQAPAPFITPFTPTSKRAGRPLKAKVHGYSPRPSRMIRSVQLFREGEI